MRRLAVAFGLVALIATYAAPLVRGGGSAGWMAGVVACLVCPALVCAVAGRAHVVFGLLANLAVVASFFVRDHWLDPRRGNTLGNGAGLVFAGIAMILSVPVSLATALAQGKGDPGEPPTCRCAVCGYDLRATPDRCPECGTVPEVSP
jgi:hypothetical protein